MLQDQDHIGAKIHSFLNKFLPEIKESVGKFKFYQDLKFFGKNRWLLYFADLHSYQCFFALSTTLVVRSTPLDRTFPVDSETLIVFKKIE